MRWGASSASGAATTRRPTFRPWPAGWWRARKRATASYGTSGAPSPTCSPTTTSAPWRRWRGSGVSEPMRKPPGVSLEIAEDTLLNKSKVDIPMGEFWVRALHPELMYYQDVRGAASASHVYGKNLVATESFTGGGYEAPYTLKKMGDYWFAQGVTRIVFHTSAHQPLDTKPGNIMVGTHINRNITSAEQARPFMTYLARNSFMLQQGLFVADLAYLLPEGAPSTMPIWGQGLQPAPPEGYDYDYVNADVVLNRMSVKEDGRLALPDGMSYRVLVLPRIERMTLPVLRKIRDLVAGGATVLGPRPRKKPSLAGYPNADTELEALATDVWGDLDGISRFQRVYGKGNVVWGLPPAQVLATLRVPRDFECTQVTDATAVPICFSFELNDIALEWIGGHRSDRDRDLVPISDGNSSELLLRRLCDGDYPGH